MSRIICWDLENLFYALVFSGSSDHLVNVGILAFAGIWYLVFGIWSMFYALVIRESCDHCRLRPAKLDWNVDRERLLCKLGRGILFSKRQMTLNSKELTMYLHIKVGMGKFSITLCL